MFMDKYMMLYYVYAYLRKSDGTPYYIGKGKGKRAYHKDHNVSVPNDKSKIIFLETHLSEVGSLAIERRMIGWYGRKDLGTGILRNQTDGGEGASGAIFSEERRAKIGTASRNRSAESNAKIADASRNRSPETRAKIVAALTGQHRTDEQRAAMSIAKSNPSEETCQKMRDAIRPPISEETKLKLTGRIHSEETKRKMSISHQDRLPISEETREKQRVAAKLKSVATSEKMKIIWEARRQGKKTPSRPDVSA